MIKSAQVIYDTSPKLRIQGSGFQNVDGYTGIKLEIGAIYQPSLRVGKDFLISKDSDGGGLILKLLGNRRSILTL